MDVPGVLGNDRGVVVVGSPSDHWRNMDELREIAKERHRAHAHQKSSTPMSPDYSLIGLMGEEAFARKFGYKDEHLRILPAGDGRVDFYSKIGTIDVKAARYPKYLFRQANKKYADILVLCRAIPEQGKVWLIGWEWDYVMVEQPVHDFSNVGIDTHYLLASHLLPMHQLRWMIDMAKGELDG